VRESTVTAGTSEALEERPHFHLNIVADGAAAAGPAGPGQSVLSSSSALHQKVLDSCGSSCSSVTGTDGAQIHYNPGGMRATQNAERVCLIGHYNLELSRWMHELTLGGSSGSKR
jgi:hypothetical protein